MSANMPVGLLNLDKPKGLSSRAIVDCVARLVRPTKSGHAGTLDPLATGVLVVCVGASTRLVSFVQEQRKEYHAVFLLGCTSDTDDVTGTVTQTENAPVPERAAVERLLQEFIGEVDQVPPQFSAAHVQGERAYRLARKGKPVELSSRKVTIYRNEIISYAHPRLELAMECSSGTYVRSIGRDLGIRLGCGAVMSELKRTRIGEFKLADAISIDRLQAEGVAPHLIAPRAAVSHLPQLPCTREELQEIRQGKPIPLSGDLASGPHRHIALLTASGELAALATNLSKGDELAPTHVFPFT